MKLSGIAASQGIVIGKAYRYENKPLSFEMHHNGDSAGEIERLDRAFSAVSKDIQALSEKTRLKLGADHAAIFEAHLEILKDPSLRWETLQRINDEKESAANAFSKVSQFFIDMFENMEDAYMRERAADIRDISAQVVNAICGVNLKSIESIDEEVILIAEDLTPSDTAKLDKNFVKGFATNIGGRTSHSAIMARTLEIPAIVGTNTVLQDTSDGDIIILDAVKGELFINPLPEVKAEYIKAIHEFEVQKKRRQLFAGLETLSLDGVHVELAANIGAPKDLDKVLANGAEGIGLYRTEFLYMDQLEVPSEEIQYEAYKKVLEGMGPKPVVIRTLDIGGDKKLPYLPLPDELNPFLGHRAIRLCLDRLDLFETQIRALLRASVHGNLKIMFPMIATIEEFNQAKAFVLKIKDKLKAEGIAVSENIEIGIMVEIPSTAVMAKQFAKVVDFFSIGTNDLIQYTFAADRMNEQVAYLYQPYHPALLSLIQNVIQASHEAGKWTGMCGEMAGDLIAIPLLLGLGLDEFSMSASSILQARELISGLKQSEVKALVQKALELDSNEAVKQLVEAFLENQK